MRIAIINTTFQQGSIGKIVHHFYINALKNNNEVKLFYGRDQEKSDDENIVKIATQWEVYVHALLSRLTGLEGYFSHFATRRLIKELDSFSPDVIFIGNLLGYFINEKMIFRYIEERKKFSLYCMMDEYAYMGKCCYPFECVKFKSVCKKCGEIRAYPPSWIFDVSGKKQKMKYKAYGNNKNIVFTGPRWVCERAKESYILKNASMYEVDEAIDVDEMFYPRDVKKLKKELGIPEENRVILNICPVSDPRKGAKYYFEAINKVSNERISFIQVGCDTENMAYPDKLIKFGYIKDQDRLAEMYSLADVLVCTSFCDTMPNVCLEALACGTPVIGFQISGIPYVASEKYGTFIEPGDTDKLAELMETIEAKSVNKINECRDYAVSRYSHTKFYEKIMGIVEERKNYDSI